MIIHRAKKPRRVRGSSNTAGMLPAVARRTKAREGGQVAAKVGRHGGGPCPAVCLATLTGWSYGEAARYLSRWGFGGRGLHPDDTNRALRSALGDRAFTGVAHRGEPVGRVVARCFAGRSGYVRCRKHVMPVVDGRLLNAAGFENRSCVGAYLLEDDR